METMVTRLSPEHERHLAPILIGGGGPDDYDDALRPRLEQRGGQFFDRLRREHPNTPLLLLTMLRTKGERLLAEVARSRDIELIVVQPWPTCCQGLPEEAKQAVAELERTARHVECLAAHQPMAGEEGQCLERAAGFIVGHSQVLLLLWDGEDRGEPAAGDVAQLAQFRLRGVPLQQQQADEALVSGDVGVLYRIHTPRGAAAKTKVGNATLQSPQFAARRFRRRLARREKLVCAAIERFNRDARRLIQEEGGEVLAKPIDGFEPGSPEPPMTAREAWAKYLLADSLAMRYQRFGRRALLVLCILAFVASCALDLGPWFAKSTLWPRFGQFFAWLLAPAIYYATRGGLRLMALWGHGFRSRWIDDRAVAEGQRVATYSRLAGNRHSVARHYRRIWRSQLGWIPDTLWSWNLLTADGSQAGNATTQPYAGPILDGWVLKERDYFETRAREVEAQLHRRRTWAVAALAVGAIFTLWSALPQVGPKLGLALAGPMEMAVHALGPWAAPWLQIVEVLLRSLLSLGTLILAYTQSESLAKLVDQYDSMGECFTRACRRLQQCQAEGNAEEFRALIDDLAREALTENAHWVLARRDAQGIIPVAN
jgi:hypothetical protein